MSGLNRHTEEEAAEIWCPKMPGLQYPNCIGSKCMAWRWVWKPKEKYRQIGTGVKPDSDIAIQQGHKEPLGEGWVASNTEWNAETDLARTWTRQATPTEGFCGDFEPAFLEC